MKISPVKRRHYNDKSKFGLTAEQSDAIRSRGACDLCGSTDSPKGLAIDHCHASGKIRGLLCYHCNLILGHAKDSPKLLRILAGYLELHQ